MKREFTKLDAWKQAHVLALEVFRSTRPLAQSRREDLAVGLCGVAFGVPSTIALGCESKSDAAFHTCLLEALDAAKALEIQLSVIHDLGLMDDRDYLPKPKLKRILKKTAEVESMLSEQISKLRAPSS